MSNATQLAGLGELSQSEIAGGALGAGLRAVRAGPGVTLASWLRGGGGGLLLPRPGLRDAYRAERAAARRWLPVLADVQILAIDERRLKARVKARAKLPGGMGARSSWRADCRRLRRWVYTAQLEAGLRQPLVKRHWSRLPDGGSTPPPRAPPALASVPAILEAARTTALRAAVALALGCRLLASELDRLKVEDVELAASRVQVRVGCRRGRARQSCARVVSMPRWCRDLVSAAAGSRPPGAWLLPRRGQLPTRWSEHLLRACKRAGVEAVTLDSIRVLGQSIARPSRLPRAAVRSSVRAPSIPGVLEGDGLVAADAQDRLAAAWPFLLRPPVQPSHCPRRAPPGCRPGEPEILAARRRARGLRSRAGGLDLPLTCVFEPEVTEAFPGEMIAGAPGEGEARSPATSPPPGPPSPPVVVIQGFTGQDVLLTGVTFGLGGLAAGAGMAFAARDAHQRGDLAEKLRAAALALGDGGEER